MRISDWSSDVCSSDLDMTLDSVCPGLTPNPRVIQLDQNRPGGGAYAPIPNFEPYRRQHVDAARIGRGRTAYLANRARLARIEAETGVPEEIMVAIYGHETNYGAYTGDFDLRSEEHTSALQSLMRISYAVFCLKKKKK